METTADEPRPGLYRHFKGGLYLVLCVASHSETEERLVVYHPAERPASVWVRPLSMWHEQIERDDYRGPRFTPVEG